ncbi:MAG: DUF4625 domain-containing protein [Bacteroidetes bacterium]|nr:DUF4625 domain-containing protein [Bacteroidota bacterium]
MKKIKILPVILIFIICFSCEENNDEDTEKPVINLDIPGAFPVNCDTIYFGETFTLKAKFSDNVELGSFSVDIHNNFDHHSHSFEITECNLSPVKTPENPFVFIQEYSIPTGKSEYTTDLSIEIPAETNKGQLDEGDYHFYINLTDKEGWSSPLGLSIKMMYRE